MIRCRQTRWLVNSVGIVARRSRSFVEQKATIIVVPILSIPERVSHQQAQLQHDREHVERTFPTVKPLTEGF